MCLYRDHCVRMIQLLALTLTSPLGDEELFNSTHFGRVVVKRPLIHFPQN